LVLKPKDVQRKSSKRILAIGGIWSLLGQEKHEERSEFQPSVGCNRC